MKNLILILVTLLITVNTTNHPKWSRELLENEKNLEILKYDMVVALDGSGNFTTISKAIEAIPMLASRMIIIKIKAGKYQENLNFPANKTNIFLVGDGKGITIITETKNGHAGYNTLDTTTVVVETDTLFLASNITFENTAGPSNYQAVALALTGHFSAFYNCEVLGYQDTIYVMQGRHFFVNCLIEGTVDFIFGEKGQVVLQDCDIQVRIPLTNQSNVITAQGRQNNLEGGIVIQNCRIGATQEFEGVKEKFKTYLGRPWKKYSRTIVMESYISDIIDPTGWLEWEGTNFGLDTLFYREYNNVGPGAQTSNRVKWEGFKVITDAIEAEPFTPRNFLDGFKWLNSTGFPYKLDL
ncbi:hypothetical protein VIGAN_09171700 [Vigna angularis var. angularis]|uniref:Pectinesterase n=1 Tax=Vigna angularis var. angularis TaxID=157739 RepID=A0A0S3SYY7_PHAAN|nr:pectinesterase-like [Vigna angularis]BAT98100.1 hypothetical protein VIGAN_09171700 [Vigna angularis var. angularis]